MTEQHPGEAHRRARSLSIRGTNPLDNPLTAEEHQVAALRTRINRERREEERIKKAANPQLTNTPTALGLIFDPPLPKPPVETIPESVWQQTLEKIATWSSSDKKKVETKVGTMNYQNYIDSTGGGPGAGPRQAPPSPSQGMNHTNGMNGGMGMGPGMVGYPTPAGHQSDLNYVMSMVEELSAVLRQNQQLTANVVEKMGKVREKASTMNLSNDELIAVVASELDGKSLPIHFSQIDLIPIIEDSKNLEKENSELRQALEKAEYDKKENWKLACHGANILADITEKMHRFKEQNESDILAWHKNYRKQLADEREENLNLRNQINDMKAAACRANEHLRQMRRFITDNDEWHELRVQNIALRQEKRFWKRLALPLLADDDSEFSDDDDLIDPEVCPLVT
jgi:hypothetical protein